VIVVYLSLFKVSEAY